MRKPKNRAVTEALLSFSQLSDGEQTAFISTMNCFLLASSKRRKMYIEQWEIEQGALKKSNDSLGHANG
ncbi:hypothetical protein HNP46_004694 [Pseudomonas nitritireducens]|uniref:Uncharacterized protein n=1 Tax=Pseudomonas nitroreducens TaxID=46680 RepID=A0A7W7P2C7_PSENT|nr:hypothetical protein [Pseudomonas nitritireducens]MBB4865793.1 hypothetical protein [Pseudomonas nitritireducens]